MTEPTVLQWKGADVDLTTVERHMSSLWKQLADRESNTCPVRTHVFNLVVFASTRSDAEAIEESLSKLDDRQPSRTIILQGDRAPDRSAIDAEVSITCPPRSGDRPARCFERLTISAWGRAADHLESVVVPLLMPELRTYLWWPGQPPFGYKSFHRLLDFADQLVVDSAQFLTPGNGFADIARLASGTQGVNDFQWARLVSWRDIVAQFFDSPGHRQYAANIQSLSLEYGSGGSAAEQQLATSGLLLMLGWAGHAFRWEPETALEGPLTSDVELSVIQGNRLIPIHIRFVDHGKDAAGKLMYMELECGGPALEHARFFVQRSDDLSNARVSQAIGSEPALERVVPLNTRTDVELLVDELELSGHDALYESAVEYASRIAGRVVWMPA
jgi:glucose-6-phosphate dehydrogenase assembly protein OpcA